MPRRPLRPRAILFAALAFFAQALASAAAARAELVLLQGGEVLKVAQAEIGDRQARLTFPSGGVMTLSVLRIDRVLADEIEPPAAPAPAVAEPAGFVLGWRDEHPQPDTPFGPEIHAAAKRHGVNPALVAAVMRAESAYRPQARSHKGARGLMQLMPATAARFGVRPEELYDPVRNLEAGVAYLRFLADRFPGVPVRVLAAYNAGEGAVARYGGVPPYRETRDYVRKIVRLLGIDEQAAASGTMTAAGG
jgi:soluble lytic murein transglycosylase-like protein